MDKYGTYTATDTVVWKTFDAKNSYDSLVMKFKHTNIIPLQNFSHEIYLNYSYV